MTFSIEIKTRKENATDTRTQGLIPGVLYGPEIESTSFSVNGLVFGKLYEEAGESNLIDLAIDGKKPVKVLIQDIQRDPVKNSITHIDLLQINMNKEMHATIPINFVGESVAVKEMGGTLNTSLEEVEVKCLPKDLVGSIEVNLSVLATFDDAVYVKDLVLPPGIVVTDSPNTAIATVSAPLTEEQLKAMEESAIGDISKVEVEKEKKEGDEEASAEGEEAKEEPKKEGNKKE
ncbi:MAG: hypothetical protein A2469_03235 [Candidatus Magasanikbacteria bacterium RIFOXYC2_FULL_40_16]|uniref:Large ribosomal subunit protein bL25 n=1 Tax=Candidatus Magasanikbacteria bacterium RIFOXYC2_FULL_40_16 TaxID=1798703 RepID=A0A1F6P1Y3_9BACT|nr:MAG: hypothetical protein A2469_03235 [Candidatus Magasanikbacteria bacterium RIFOXYC2_FULL_40_16]